MGKILESGTLGFHEIMTEAKTYTGIVITLEPDSNPLPAWSDAGSNQVITTIRSMTP